MNTLESFAATVQDMVRHVGTCFTQPDQDWIPIAVLQGRDGKITIAALVIQSREDKNALPGMLRKLVKDYRLNRMALMLSCWELKIEAIDPLAETTLEMANRFGVRDHPDRYESLHLECGDRDDNWMHYRAKIIRHPDGPPTLSEWEQQDLQATGYRFERIVQRAFLNSKGGR